jgi:RNA polymerase sigma-70 factor (ECF subfamily)
MEIAQLVNVAAGAPSDAEVVRRVLAGERALFEILMRRHNQRLYRTIRAILRDEAEVEDAMQQAYVSAYAHLAQFAGDASFSTWLTRIAVNEALGRLRRRAPLASLDETPETQVMSFDPSRDDPELRVARREASELLEAAVDELPAGYRTVFMLREVEGLSTAETAAALGVSEDVVKVRLHRARGALREALFERVGGAAREAFPFYAPRCDRVVAGVMARIGGGT